MITRKIKLAIGIFMLACALSLAAATAWFLWGEFSVRNQQTIGLLVPDEHDAAALDLWRQAALEEGIQLEAVTASAFLRPFAVFRKEHGGLIVPDGIHRRGNDILTARLKKYVHDGGKLMLVYDALTLDLNGSYAPERARLSDLAGVDYALYRKYGDATSASDAIGATAAAMRKIGITPGRYATENPLRYVDQVIDRWLTTYQYGTLKYPLFTTGVAATPANVLMLGANGSVAAIEHSFGEGKSLFINLPLGFLQTRTDGLLLHAFLRYFSDEIAELPRLLPSPKGIGGMVLNIHVDSGDAIGHLNFMQGMGVFEQGPYSIHFTAGPDVDKPGDAKGMNAEHNPTTQAWIRKLALGNAIGNHGGWIHNYFSEQVTETNGTTYQPLLDKNNDVMTRILGKPVLEYAAPNGNHPAWITDWLVQQRALAYYTTANGGEGATRMIDASGKVDRRIWSIPVTPFGRIASFEEAMFAKLPSAAISGWLGDVSNFVADSKNIRLIYCHPLGVRFYASAVSAWMKTAKSLARNNVFKWYTMTEVAQFMSKRESTAWSFDSGDGSARLSANNPQSLDDLTWRIPKKQCEMPVIVSGQGTIVSYPGAWQITASQGRDLLVHCKVAPA